MLRQTKKRSPKKCLEQSAAKTGDSSRKNINSENDDDDTNTSYSPKGTLVSGHGDRFEKQVFRLCCLTLALSDHVESFYMAYNDADAGDFDDTVLFFRVHGQNQFESLFIQTKHSSSSEAKITLEMLRKKKTRKKKPPFGIKIYYDSLKGTLETMDTIGPSEVRGNLAFGNAILCTNMDIDEELLTEYSFESISVGNRPFPLNLHELDSGKLYLLPMKLFKDLVGLTVSPVQSKLYLFVNFPDYNNLDDILIRLTDKLGQRWKTPVSAHDFKVWFNDRLDSDKKNDYINRFTLKSSFEQLFGTKQLDIFKFETEIFTRERLFKLLRTSGSELVDSFFLPEGPKVLCCFSSQAQATCWTTVQIYQTLIYQRRIDRKHVLLIRLSESAENKDQLRSIQQVIRFPNSSLSDGDPTYVLIEVVDTDLCGHNLFTLQHNSVSSGWKLILITHQRARHESKCCKVERLRYTDLPSWKEKNIILNDKRDSFREFFASVDEANHDELINAEVLKELLNNEDLQVGESFDDVNEEDGSFENQFPHSRLPIITRTLKLLNYLEWEQIKNIVKGKSNANTPFFLIMVTDDSNSKKFIHNVAIKRFIKENSEHVRIVYLSDSQSQQERQESMENMLQLVETNRTVHLVQHVSLPLKQLRAINYHRALDTESQHNEPTEESGQMCMDSFHDEISDRRHFFAWQASYNSMGDIIHNQVDREKFTTVGEDKLSLTKLPLITVIAAEPGMGKSYFATNQLPKRHVFSERFCLKFIINLIDHHSQLTKEEFSTLEQVATFLSATQKSNSPILQQFAKGFLQYLSKEHAILIVFDGFDEITYDAQTKLIDLIHFLERKVRMTYIVVTTRYHDIDHLARTIMYRQYDFVPVSKKQQTDYLQDCWKCASDDSVHQAVKLIEHLESTMNSKLRQLLGTPLLCRIIAETYMPTETNRFDFPQSLNILELYAKFLETKFYIYLKRLDLLQTTPFHSCMWKYFCEVHQCVSFHFLFPDTSKEWYHRNIPLLLLDEPLLEAKTLINGAGIVRIEQLNENFPFHFIHRTFAEYLVARFFASYLNNLKIYPEFYVICINFLALHMFKTSNMMIRYFLENWNTRAALFRARWTIIKQMWLYKPLPVYSCAGLSEFDIGYIIQEPYYRHALTQHKSGKRIIQIPLPIKEICETLEDDDDRADGFFRSIFRTFTEYHNEPGWYSRETCEYELQVSSLLVRRNLPIRQLLVHYLRNLIPRFLFLSRCDRQYLADFARQRIVNPLLEDHVVPADEMNLSQWFKVFDHIDKNDILSGTPTIEKHMWLFKTVLPVLFQRVNDINATSLRNNSPNLRFCDILMSQYNEVNTEKKIDHTQFIEHLFNGFSEQSADEWFLSLKEKVVNEIEKSLNGLEPSGVEIIVDGFRILTPNIAEVLRKNCKLGLFTPNTHSILLLLAEREESYVTIDDVTSIALLLDTFNERMPLQPSFRPIVIDLIQKCFESITHDDITYDQLALHSRMQLPCKFLVIFARSLGVWLIDDPYRKTFHLRHSDHDFSATIKITHENLYGLIKDIIISVISTMDAIGTNEEVSSVISDLS